MEEQVLIKKLQATAAELKSHGYTMQQLIRLVSDSTFVPITVFAGEQSPLRSIVTYLHHNEGMEYNKIAEKLHRSYRAVWGADQKAAITPAPTEYYIPLSCFDDKKSVLESVVTHMRSQEGLKFTEIALLLKKDPRTIWTAWNRAQRKEMRNMEGLQPHIDKFARYIEQEQLISPNKKIVVLISGGKDSNALAVLLEEYRKQHPIDINYINVMFPQDLFGKDIEERQKLIGEGLENYTSVIPEEQEKVLASTDKPCRLCKDIREREIAKILKDENKEDLIIMTGHTQDDIYAYFAEITGMNLRAAIEKPDYNKIAPIDICLENLEHLSRFFPKLTLHEGITLIKPLLAFNSQEIQDILKITNTEKHTTCCMYYCNRPKRNLFHIMNLLPQEEIKHIYIETSPKKLLETIKQHAHNYEWAIDAIKHKHYEELLL